MSFILSDHPAFGTCRDCSFGQTRALPSSLMTRSFGMQPLQSRSTIFPFAFQYKRLSVNGNVGSNLLPLDSLVASAPETLQQRGELLASIIHSRSYEHHPYQLSTAMIPSVIKPHHSSSHKQSNSPNSRSHER
jgi:hypothetical protein